MIRIAVEALRDGLSLRQAAATLRRLGAWLGFDAPSFSTVRLWALRLGLHLWGRPAPAAADWIWIADHVAEAGGGKCLTIVGVRRSQLRPDLALRHGEVALLHADARPTCTGDALYQTFAALAARLGVPVQIVSDHGSDMVKGTRRFQAEHSSVALTWDITHRAARLLLAALKNDPAWAAFKAACQRTRRAVERTPWAALAPPATTGASRCEHFDTLTLWGVATLRKLAGGAAGVLAACARGATAVLDGGQGVRDCEACFGWLAEFAAALRQEWLPLVEATYSAERQVKHGGLHGGSAADWRAKQPPLPRGAPPRVRRHRAALLQYLRHEGRGRPRDQPLLATSDVLESLFGKYKRYTERGPARDLGSAILTLPLPTAEPTPALLAEALVSAPVAVLRRWCAATFGPSTLALQRRLQGLPHGTEPA